MKVERWEEETDEEWAYRLAEEITLANNTEVSKYFIERDPYADDGVIINYIGEDSWTWKEHPEGPFKATQIIEWKNKAEKWNLIEPMLPKITKIIIEAKQVTELLGLVTKPRSDNDVSQ